MKTRIFGALLAFFVLAGVPAFAQTPSETGLTLTAQKYFVFRYLSAGLRKDGDIFTFEDFFIAISYWGYENVKVNVRLTAPGLDFTYRSDSLGRPLKIIGGQVKRTIILNVSGLAFDIEPGVYFSDIVAEISADKPVYVAPPRLVISASGFGRTAEEAVETAWERVGCQVPSITEAGMTIFPYAIFWRNLSGYPNGWDTRITLENISGGKVSVLVYYLPDYNFSYDPLTCQRKKERSFASWAFPLVGGETRSMWLREMLGATLNDSWSTEGSFAFIFLRGSAQDVLIRSEVTPLLTGGKRICY